MALSSASTLAEVEAEYDDTASYAQDISVDKAKRFVVACRILLRRMPSSATKAGASLQQRIDLLRDELRDAQKWLEKFDTDNVPGPVITRPDFRSYRGGPL